MGEPILCKSCGYVIGHYFEEYYKMRDKFTLDQLQYRRYQIADLLENDQFRQLINSYHKFDQNKINKVLDDPNADEEELWEAMPSEIDLSLRYLTNKMGYDPTRMCCRIMFICYVSFDNMIN